MEAPFQNKRSRLTDPVLRRWMIGIGIVWLVLAVIYALLALQTHKKQKALTGSGTSLITAFSEKAGLPLLEQNITQLRDMLNDIGDQPEVLYATVVDHKNKIIAYTDAGRLLPPRNADETEDNGVSIWMDEDAMIFSSDILFSGTSIGEIRLALTRASIVRSKRMFGIIAGISLFGLCLAGAILHGRDLLAWMKRRRGATCNHAGMDDASLHCPLCGQGIESSGAFCHAALDADKNVIFRLTGSFLGRDGASGLQLAEIGSNPELASIKGQMIRQCAEIISKLSVNDGYSGKPAGGI